MANRGDDVVKCLRCYVCMAERAVTQTRRCAVNPLIGRELEGMDIARSPRSRKVLVVGGGIAGMVAAATAARRGHDVVLCEREGELGGILRTEAALPFKRDMGRLPGAHPTRASARRFGVDVRLNTEVDAAFAERIAPDAVIVAVGSAPIPMPLPSKRVRARYRSTTCTWKASNRGMRLSFLAAG